MTRDVLEYAKRKPPGSLDYSLEMLAEMRCLEPQPNSAKLFERPGFQNLQFIQERNVGELDETPLFDRLNGTPQNGPYVCTPCGVCAVSELGYGQFNVGRRLLYAFLDEVGAVPYLIGAFESFEIDGEPYIVYWMPGGLLGDNRPTFCFVRANGISHFHEHLRDMALSLVGEDERMWSRRP